jgi:hypothetical protein
MALPRSAAGEVKVVTLSLPIRLAVPSLLVTSLPRRAIGFSFEGGRAGAVTGGGLLAATVLLAGALFQVVGPAGIVAAAWLTGTTGAVMLYNSARSVAFVKPLCSGCRLLPVIEEHEALHLSGIESDDEIWRQMRSRHSCESLSLEGDPAICSFCPIPKRLREH